MGKEMSPRNMKDATKLWNLDDAGDLQMSIVKTGSTDGSKIEIVSGKDVEAGMQVISKQTTTSKTTTTSSNNMSMMRPF